MVTTAVRFAPLLNQYVVQAGAAGGIQTVNRELACAVVEQHPEIGCTALVASASDVEREHARQHGVTLIAGESRANRLPSARV